MANFVKYKLNFSKKKIYNCNFYFYSESFSCYLRVIGLFKIITMDIYYFFSNELRFVKIVLVLVHVGLLLLLTGASHLFAKPVSWTSFI